MSFKLACEQIVSIVKALPVDTKAVGSGSKWRHIPDMLLDVDRPSLPDTRGFSISTPSTLALHSPVIVANAPYRAIADAEIVVFYRASKDQASMNDVIVSDYFAICEALSNPANWGRPDSTIVMIGNSGNERFPARTEKVQGDQFGGILLRIACKIQFTR